MSISFEDLRSISYSFDFLREISLQVVKGNKKDGILFVVLGLRYLNIVEEEKVQANGF